MSSVSQTPAPRPAPRLQLGFGRRMAVGLIVTLAILAVALRGAWPVILDKAVHARPHAPDLALFGGLPLAIKAHILAALGALALGAALMVVRKGRLFHRTAGWLWVGLVSVVAGSSLFIRALNHGAFSVLHVFTAVTLIALPLGVMWARRHQVSRHRSAMMGLFYGAFAINMLFAFIPGRTMWNLFFG